MSLWPLPLFPEGSLASSVITTVWIGVFIVCLMNLRFGWVLSGLVVPGYLAPLLIAKPVSAGVVMIEAVITYGLFWLLSERLAHHRRWSSFFGRDRFMGLILVSVVVRLTLDGWLLPMLADNLDRYYGLSFDWQNSLHSFGLIVVALLANQFYKPGLVRGLLQSAVAIGVTCLIVRYGLMELTNFRIAGVVYLYEGFASSILASPKAYIILIVTCFIASRMNLLYGWDFGGIMIPALLALEWYQPTKILTSFLEAFIIYGIGALLLRSRLFAGTTVEGARKILLFFNISFAYKLLLGHVLVTVGVEQRITDYYGFGYLLPTLIAIKAYDKGILARVTGAVAQISLSGALIGSLVGFVLTFGRSDGAAYAAAPDYRPSPLTGAMVAARISGQARIDRGQGTAAAVSALSASGFAQGVEALDRAGPSEAVRAILAEAGYSVQRLADGKVAVRPRDGRGFALIHNPAAAGRVAVVCADPDAAPLMGLAAYAVFERQDARWIVLGESKAGLGTRSSSAAGEFLRQALHSPLLQIVKANGDASVLRLIGETGRLIGLNDLLRSAPDVRLALAEPLSPHSVLALSRAGIRELVANATPLASRPSASYGDEELAFIRYDLLGPLLRSGPGTNLQFLQRAAASVGLELSTTHAGPAPVFEIRRAGVPGEFYLLRPAATGPVLQASNAPPIEVLSRKLFDRLDARGLLVAPLPQVVTAAEIQLEPLITQALNDTVAGSPLTLQLRPRPNFGGPAGSVLAVDRIEPAGGMTDRLKVRLRKAGVNARLLQRDDPLSAGLEIGPAPQLRYVQQAQGGRAAVLWIGAAR